MKPNESGSDRPDPGRGAPAETMNGEDASHPMEDHFWEFLNGTPDGILVVKGRADLRGRELQLVALEISEPQLGADGAGPRRGPRNPLPRDPLVLDLTPSACTGGLISRLKGLLSMHPGQVPVVFRLVDNGDVTRLRLGDDYRVDGSAALLSELHRLLGREAARFEDESAVAAARPARSAN